jgi:hypothetical protein
MTRFNRSIQIAVLALVTAARARAQSQKTIVLTAPYAPVNQGAVTAFGYYMSPYSGTVDGSVVRLNCVDFFHDVWIGDVWQANDVNLGQAGANLGLLNTTRDGNAPNEATFGNSLSNVLDVYREMAWLTDQQPGNPGLNSETALRTAAIQTAIWAIGDPGYEGSAGWGINALDQYAQLNGADFNAASNDPNTTAYWIEQAEQNALSLSLINSGYYYRFNVVTNVSLTAEHGAQEFVYSVPADQVNFASVVSTPEPGTLVLIGTGLIGMLGVASRAKRKNDRDRESDG